MNRRYEDIVTFHGHSCPGLAMGYRLTVAALDYLERQRADDEELVAITENNACGVDALQFLSGCTFGKGNLVFRDYGKMAYTLYSRTSGRGVRVLFHREAVPAAVKGSREEYIQWLLTVEERKIISLRPADGEVPAKARILESVPCANCGEMVMASRIRTVNGRSLCIPCHEAG